MTDGTELTAASLDLTRCERHPRKCNKIKAWAHKQTLEFRTGQLGRTRFAHLHRWERRAVTHAFRLAWNSEQDGCPQCVALTATDGCDVHSPYDPTCGLDWFRENITCIPSVTTRTTYCPRHLSDEPLPEWSKAALICGGAAAVAWIPGLGWAAAARGGMSCLWTWIGWKIF